MQNDATRNRPFSIRLFFPEGTPLGLTVATIPNWAGSMMRCRSASLPALLERGESGRPGIYILQGPNPNAQSDFDPLQVYVGQAGRIKDRLPQSAREREFWDMAAVVTTADTNFSSAHFLALESAVIDAARKIGRNQVMNSVAPREDAGGLGEADRAEVDTFLSQIMQVLPVLGFDLLRPRPLASPTNSASSSSFRTQNDIVRFEIRRKDNFKATAQEIDGEFVVLAGSKALASPGFKSNTYAVLRQKLRDNNSLIEDSYDDFLQFSINVGFTSPSAAAAVVLDRNSNGRTEWRKEGSDLTYEGWQAIQVNGALSSVEGGRA